MIAGRMGAFMFMFLAGTACAEFQASGTIKLEDFGLTAALMAQKTAIPGTCAVGTASYSTFSLAGLPDATMNGCYTYLQQSNADYPIFASANATVFSYFPELITTSTTAAAIPTWGALTFAPGTTNVTNLCVTEDNKYAHPVDIVATAAWYCAPGTGVKLTAVPAGTVAFACEDCAAAPVDAGNGTCSCTCSIGADGSITSLITPISSTNTTTDTTTTTTAAPVAPADNSTDIPLIPGGI